MRNVGTPAQRGQLFVCWVDHATTYNNYSQPTEVTRKWVLSRVASVSDDGRVLAFHDDCGVRRRGRPPQLWLVPLRFGDRVWRAWLARDLPREFDSLDAIRAWMRSQPEMQEAQEAAA